MTFLLVLLVIGMLEWWYWWVIPSIIIALVACATHKWAIAAGIPVVMLVVALFVMDAAFRGLR